MLAYLFKLALRELPQIAHSDTMIGHEHQDGVVQHTARLQVLQELEQVIVEQTERIVIVMTGLGVKYEAELGLVGVHAKELAHPIEHVGVTRDRAQTQTSESCVVSLGFEVEHAHVVIDRLFAKAHHSQLERANRLHVLRPLCHVARPLELVPHPRKVIHVGCIGEATPRLRQLGLLVAGQNGQESLRSAIAHNIVALEDDEAELDHVGVGFGQHAEPGHARDRVEAEHEHVVAEGLAWQRVPRVTHLQAGLVGDARVNVGVDGAVLGAAVDLEEVCDQRHLVHDRKYAIALVHRKVVVTPFEKRMNSIRN
jgi:hypothetical protein